MKKLTGLSLSILLLLSCGGETESTSNKMNTEKTIVQNEQHVDNIQNNEVESQTVDSSLNNITDELIGKNEENITAIETDKEEETPNKSIIKVAEVVSDITPKIEEVVEETVVKKPNHAMWDGLLKQNVNSSGKVNYTGMKSSLTQIESYIKQLESFTNLSDLNRNEKLAYWINLYNAATVRLIVQHYPVKSITDISGGKPWDKKVVTIGSKQYTLNQIENDIIRPRFNEPRIHFAVNCAAKSCPKLMNSAFTADKLNYQLTKQAKAFINGSKNEISANKIAISKIFEWYAEDFGSSVIDFINKYSTTKVDGSATVEYKEYNWDLNN